MSYKPILEDDLEDFTTRLLDLISNNGATTFSIVLNGRYFMEHSRMVYVKIRRNSDSNRNDLFFYTKRAERPKEVEAPDALTDCADILVNSCLYGHNLGVEFTLKDCTIYLDADLNLLIIESGIYHAIRDFATNRDLKSLTRYCGSKITEHLGEVNSLTQIFKERAYKNFSSIIFCRTSNKFMYKFYSKRYRFYKTMYSFIPALIFYPYLYNPLFDNPDNNIKMFKIYQIAIEKNRVVESPNGLKAYMLTHAEICRAFSMKHFMRFMPSFFYDILVGLLNPTLDTFPSTDNKVFVKPDNLDVTTNLPQCYSRARFIYELQKCSTSSEQAAKDKLEILKKYVEKDSLYYCCEKNLKNLINYGPAVLDPPRLNADTIYSYLQEMTLTLA